MLNTVLTQIYHLKRDNAVKYTKKNENIRPFESGGETSLEFFSLKTDCSLFVVSKKKNPFLDVLFVIWLYMIDRCSSMFKDSSIKFSVMSLGYGSTVCLVVSCYIVLLYVLNLHSSIK